ncbi:YhgE/Pip family protein [Limosilactobacillus sp.]|uniref:YhgE/Pip family protein n=1 Tax=Limosilactobacillus sp. TaxID=2773925 RepID=UPI00345E159E
MWNMIKAEFKNIRHNRLLLISTTVICIIPLLYSIFFLKSVWDPYGSTENLPVAVVNKDIPVEYRGQKMDVGHQMTKELKKNKQLKWEIVSAKKARYGLSHRQYYTVVTIPKNFSQNATTVLDKHPQQMKLKYETNGSLNYIGEVISQLGMTKLKERIRAQVTRAYATAMFQALHKVGKGMKTAASGSKQLSDGLITLQSGANQYVAGVSQVNDGVQTLRVSVTPLASGAQQLATGSQTLTNGIGQYTGGVGQLASGLATLNNNSGQLQSGSQQLATGAGQLNSAVNSSLGSIDFQGILATMNQADSLKQNLAQLQSGLSQAQSALGGVSDSAKKLQQASGSLSGLASAGSALRGVAQNDASIAQIAGQVAQKDGVSDDVKSQMQQIASKAQSNASTIQKLSGTLGQLNSLQSSLQGMQSQLNQLSSMSSVLNSAGTTIQQANGLLNQLDGYKSTLSAMPASVNQLKNATGQIAAGSASLNSGINQYTAGVAQAGAGANQLTANSGQLNSGAGQLSGALGQLNAQVPALVAGVDQLADGTQQLVDNSPTLIGGVIRLQSGAGRLARALTRGAMTVNGIKTSPRTAKMIAEPANTKHKNYSYVPNYGHALAPYVLSVALYVGILVFNFVYPIRRVADRNGSGTAWWMSKVVVGGLAAIAMAVVECTIMMLCGLTIDHVPSFYLTTALFGLASMAIVMFLSMTFDNPGRFIAMVLLMLQLGGSGGTFPMQVTMKFYNIIHWYLPMTYSILGLRQGISSGLGTHYAMFCNLVLLGIAVVFNLLLLWSMKGIASHSFHAPSVASMKMNAHGPMGPGDEYNSDDHQNKN